MEALDYRSDATTAAQPYITCSYLRKLTSAGYREDTCRQEPARSQATNTGSALRLVDSIRAFS